MSLTLVVWVTPNVTVPCCPGNSVRVIAPCNGWPQVSSEGIFHCSANIACSPSGPGDDIIQNVSSPQAVILKVSPSLPVGLSCAAGSSKTVTITGQMGYSGTATVDIDIL